MSGIVLDSEQNEFLSQLGEKAINPIMYKKTEYFIVFCNIFVYLKIYFMPFIFFHNF